MLRALGVIPARFESARFRGKPLAPLAGGTLLEAVWRGTSASTRLGRVVVATEDDRIVEECRRVGAEVMLTSPDHSSGSDRVAEVVHAVGAGWDVVVNVQGDEPLVTGRTIDRLVEALAADPVLDIATPAEPIREIEDLFDPNVVKVVTDGRGRALYFSRAPIPYRRAAAGALAADFRATLTGAEALAGYRKHQGIYACRRDALLRWTGLPVSALERSEGLEQLRALEAGLVIAIVPSDFESIGVDTPQDLARAEARMAALRARAQEAPR